MGENKMAKSRNISKKQRSVIEDIFAGQLTLEQVLAKHNISRLTYYKWLADKRFAEQFDMRIAASFRESSALLAGYSPIAAVRLINLTESEKPETARKACLDIISMQSDACRANQKAAPAGNSLNKNDDQLAPETAGKLLAALAEEN